MRGVVVRDLRLDEVGGVREVWDAAGLAYRPGTRDAPESLAREVAGDRSSVIGAFSGDRLVGVVVATHDGRKGWINRLAVVPGHRRRGIGRLLVEACEVRLRDAGVSVFACLMFEDNAASKELFEQAGYTSRPDVVYLRKADEPGDW